MMVGGMGKPQLSPGLQPPPQLGHTSTLMAMGCWWPGLLDSLLQTNPVLSCESSPAPQSPLHRVLSPHVSLLHPKCSSLGEGLVLQPPCSVCNAISKPSTALCRAHRTPSTDIRALLQQEWISACSLQLKQGRVITPVSRGETTAQQGWLAQIHGEICIQAGERDVVFCLLD